MFGKTKRLKATIKAWEQMATTLANATEFYRGLLVQCGEAIGEDAYIIGDGKWPEDMLVANVPELVRRHTRMRASEAIVGFLDWLTTRDEVLSIGSSRLAAQFPQLVELWTKTNNLPRRRSELVPSYVYPEEIGRVYPGAKPRLRKKEKADD